MGGWTASKSRLVINAAAELQQMAFKIDFACMNVRLWAIKTSSSISKVYFLTHCQFMVTRIPYPEEKQESSRFIPVYTENIRRANVRAYLLVKDDLKSDYMR